MTYEQLRKALPPKGIPRYLKEQRPVLDNEPEKKKMEQIKGLIDAAVHLLNLTQFGAASEQIILGFFVDKEIMFRQLKRSGNFRHSKYLGQRNPVPGFIKDLLTYRDLLVFSPQEIKYLKSLSAFEIIDSEMRDLDLFIRGEIKKFSTYNQLVTGKGFYPLSKLKALLAMNELHFMLLTDAKERTHADQIDFYTKEDISYAISYLIRLYNEMIGFDEPDMGIADIAYAQSPSMTKLLVAACKLMELKQFEIELEVYNHECKIEKGTAIIFHPDPDFAKCIELSNIMLQFQDAANLAHAHRELQEVPSFESVAKDIHTNFPEFFDTLYEPCPRYVLKIPIPIYQEFLVKHHDKFFREEIPLLKNLEKTLLLPYDRLHEYEIVPGFSFEDLIQINRFFVLQYYLYICKIQETILNDRELLMRSLLGAFKQNELIDLLSEMYPTKKVKIFLDLVTWDAENPAMELDLLYLPIIRYTEYLAVSVCMMRFANISRGIFMSQARKGNNLKAANANRHFSIADSLSQELDAHGFTTASEIRVKYRSTSKNESDVDFLAFKDGVLFIAECKDAIHPTDLFEMRTTYEYLDKAAIQLDYLTEALQHRDQLQKVCEAAGIQGEVKQIVPLIILSSNKHWGNDYKGFPVRGLRELSGFFRSGSWTVGDLSGEGLKIKFWKTDALSPNDIIHYCGKTGPHRCAYDACGEHYYVFSPKIKKHTYVLYPEKMSALLTAKYPFEKLSAAVE